MHIPRHRLQDFISRSLIGLTVAIGVFISGCVPPGTSVDWEPEETYDPDISRTGWSSPASSMGIIPIMPPSEDVRVGDMYVYSFNPDACFRQPVARTTCTVLQSALGYLEPVGRIGAGVSTATGLAENTRCLYSDCG